MAPSRAASTGTLGPINVTVLADGTTTVDLHLDLGGAGSVGSYGAVVRWDPAVLDYLGFTGGVSPFDTPAVNTANVAAGELRFADAAALAASGRVRVLSVSFEAIAAPPATSPIDLELTSLYADETFEDMLPGAIELDAEACVADFDYRLRLDGGPVTVLDWTAVPQASSYDVIRGDLDDPLGVVDCLENDSLDTTTGAGAEAANPDLEIPAEGRGFFYLVRFHDGSDASTYGYIEHCALERSVVSGDCAR